MGLRSLSDGVLWRLRGVGRDARVSAALARRRSPDTGHVLARFARSPQRNGPWYLQRFGAGALGAVQAACEAEGLQPFLAFGTLLGHTREGGFIPSDDDIDLGMFQDDFEALPGVAARLHAQGFRSHQAAPFQWAFWAPHLGDVHVDIFLMERFEGGFRSRALSHKGEHGYLLPAEALRALEPTSFMGIACAQPADPRAFLAAHYGPGWRHPDPAWDYRSDAASEISG